MGLKPRIFGTSVPRLAQDKIRRRSSRVTHLISVPDCSIEFSTQSSRHTDRGRRTAVIFVNPGPIVVLQIGAGLLKRGRDLKRLQNCPDTARFIRSRWLAAEPLLFTSA